MLSLILKIMKQYRIKWKPLSYLLKHLGNFRDPVIPRYSLNLCLFIIFNLQQEIDDDLDVYVLNLLS